MSINISCQADDDCYIASITVNGVSQDVNVLPVLIEDLSENTNVVAVCVDPTDYYTVTVTEEGCDSITGGGIFSEGSSTTVSIDAGDPNCFVKKLEINGYEVPATN